MSRPPLTPLSEDGDSDPALSGEPGRAPALDPPPNRRLLAVVGVFSAVGWLLAFPAAFLWTLFYVVVVVPGCVDASPGQMAFFSAVYASVGTVFASCTWLLARALGAWRALAFGALSFLPFIATFIGYLVPAYPLRGFCF